MRRPPVLAALAALALVLAGCGGDPKPTPVARPTASPSASASASASPPALPASSRVKSGEGAEAAVQYFLDSMAYAGATGDTNAFEDAYLRSCTKCQAITDGIRTTYEAGGSLEGGAWRATKLKFYAIKGDVAYVDAVVDYEPQTWIKDSKGTTQESPARHNVLKAFQLVWQPGGWRVGALDPQT